MGKRKIEMKLTENEKARKKVFEKRKTTLLKKAEELSILCDVKLLLIIYELDRQKPEIWLHNINDEEAQQIINRFKQQPGRFNKKKELGEKFAVSDHQIMIINQFSDHNELRKLCCELDAKIDAVMYAIKSRQALTEGIRSSNMLGDHHQGIGFLNNGKGKEVVVKQEPVHNTQQGQSFQTLWNMPDFMETPLMMMHNDVSYSGFDFDVINTASYVPLPIDYVDPSWMQPAYMNANSWMSNYEPTMDHISPGNFSSMMLLGFDYQLNASH